MKKNELIVMVACQLCPDGGHFSSSSSSSSPEPFFPCRDASSVAPNGQDLSTGGARVSGAPNP
jgi:hypothetical protein